MNPGFTSKLGVKNLGVNTDDFFINYQKKETIEENICNNKYAIMYSF